MQGLGTKEWREVSLDLETNSFMCLSKVPTHISFVEQMLLWCWLRASFTERSSIIKSACSLSAFLQFGRTEVIDNTLNPDFVRKFVLDFFFEEKQNLRFDV